MPLTSHIERHFEATATVRDIVIGMADGLTVPFALAAGLSGTVDASTIVVVAGLAEIAAGSIAMGLGGYLAARTDLEHYISELKREWRETKDMPEEEADEVAGMFRKFEMREPEIAPVVDAIRADRKRWVDFMMRFELGLERPDPKRARRSAATIAGSYIAGGFIPLLPYMLVHNVSTALSLSVGVTLIALFVFGYVKGHFTGLPPMRGAVQTTLIGGLAAGAAFSIAKLIGH
ncbi:MAG TPA: VIT1/CCC1 transporter family protein [Bryobacteraceae bacterium]|jgi:VIT1/CCC1 family predicted Fe2+/Mn2+ transporter|nr:VIT1/CCC1 transporter family protein [Bryobacteraceae bacterium]